MAVKGMFEHQRGCTPLRPCTSCEALTFLRAKLQKEEFDEFIRIANGSKESTGTRKRSERSATAEPIQKNAKLDDYLSLSADALRALSKAGIKTMGDLLKQSKESILESTDIDGRALRGIVGQLEKLGASLKQ